MFTGPVHIKIGDAVAVIVDTSAVAADLPVAAVRPFGSRTVGYAVPAGGVEAEELGAHSVVLEAGRRPAVLPALGVEGEQLPRQHARQRFVLVGQVVEAGRCVAVQEVMELFHGAGRPSEAFFRVSEVAHDVTVFPATSPRPRTPQV